MMFCSCVLIKLLQNIIDSTGKLTVGIDFDLEKVPQEKKEAVDCEDPRPISPI